MRVFNNGRVCLPSSKVSWGWGMRTAGVGSNRYCAQDSLHQSGDPSIVGQLQRMTSIVPFDGTYRPFRDFCKASQMSLSLRAL